MHSITELGFKIGELFGLSNETRSDIDYLIGRLNAMDVLIDEVDQNAKYCQTCHENSTRTEPYKPPTMPTPQK